MTLLGVPDSAIAVTGCSLDPASRRCAPPIPTSAGAPPAGGGRRRHAQEPRSGDPRPRAVRPDAGRAPASRLVSPAITTRRSDAVLRSVAIACRRPARPGRGARLPAGDAALLACTAGPGCRLRVGGRGVLDPRDRGHGRRAALPGLGHPGACRTGDRPGLPLPGGRRRCAAPEAGADGGRPGLAGGDAGAAGRGVAALPRPRGGGAVLGCGRASGSTLRAPAVLRGHRPRVAMLSPLPPDRSGVADYTAATCRSWASWWICTCSPKRRGRRRCAAVARMRPLSALPHLSAGFDRVSRSWATRISTPGSSCCSCATAAPASPMTRACWASTAACSGPERALAVAGQELGRPGRRRQELERWLGDEGRLEALFLGEIAEMRGADHRAFAGDRGLVP